MPEKDQIIADFHAMEVAWLMQFDNGWWACFNDERPIGPFATEVEAAQAGLDKWGTSV